MSRSLDSNLLAAATSGHLRFCNLATFELDSGTLYFASTPFSIVYGGHTYIGVGNLVSVGPVAETTESQANVLTLVLSGIPSANIAVALTENVQGRVATIYWATFDAGWRMLGTPDVGRRGRIDTMKIVIDSDTCQIEVAIRDNLADWDTPPIARYTQDDQHVLFPGDDFFEFVPQMAQKELKWGA